jgi:glyceraldehyde-3-phosphate dehydrogenase/erythrose-4-phosphate dehydrogenase
MATNVAINGFGRIGRLALRGMLERHKQELSVVAVNDMADLHTNTHLFRYDSTWTERWPRCSPGTITNGDTAAASVIWQP